MKINPIFSHVFSALVGIILALFFAERVLPWSSIHIWNREHLLSIYTDDAFSKMIDEPDKILVLKLENKHPAFTIEDINLNVVFSGKIKEPFVSADQGVFGYEISKGQEALSFSHQSGEFRNIPSSNYRNIKIGKIFPDSVFILSVPLDTELEGDMFFPYKSSELGSVEYSVDYSYKFCGATVRRSIKK